MTAPKLFESFESFPTEVIVPIMAPTLHALLNASPIVFRIFNRYAAEIFESALDASDLTISIPAIIRVIVLIRSSTLPVHSLRDFVFVLLNPTMSRTASVATEDHNVLLDKPITKTNPPTILRNLLAVSNRISQLTDACLQHYLDRLMTIKPSRPLDLSFRYGSNSPKGLHCLLANIPSEEREEPKGERHEVRDAGPPSWVEEQSVTHAMWRIQIFLDLKTAAAQSLLSWPERDVQVILEMEAMDFYEKCITLATEYPFLPGMRLRTIPGRSELQTTETAMDFLDMVLKREGKLPEGRFQLPLPPADWKRRWPGAIPRDMTWYDRYKPANASTKGPLSMREALHQYDLEGRDDVTMKVIFEDTLKHDPFGYLSEAQVAFPSKD